MAAAMVVAWLVVAASPSGARVEWTPADASCPARAELESSIAELAGVPVERVRTSSPAFSFSADVAVPSGDEAPWRASLAVRSPAGSTVRSLSAPTCAALARAIEIIAATALTSAAEAEARADARAGPDVVASVGDGWRWLARIAPAAEVGSLPRFGGGASIAVGVEHERARVELTGAWWPRRDATFGGAVLGEVTLASAGLRGCLALLDDASLAMGACIGAEVGRLSGQGRNVATPRSVSTAWLAASAEVFAAYRMMPWLALVPRLGLVAPATRPELVIDDVGLVHRPAPIAPRAELGIEVMIP